MEALAFRYGHDLFGADGPTYRIPRTGTAHQRQWDIRKLGVMAATAALAIQAIWVSGFAAGSQAAAGRPLSIDVSCEVVR